VALAVSKRGSQDFHLTTGLPTRWPPRRVASLHEGPRIVPSILFKILYLSESKGPICSCRETGRVAGQAVCGSVASPGWGRGSFAG
jgi:hypothetical protein